MAWSKIGNLKGPAGNNVKGDPGDPGTPGTPGASVKGDPGNAGPRGTSFISGNGAPSAGVGQAGDTYLDVVTGDLYTIS